MKRKLTVALIAGATFLSAIGGGASLLATAPNSSVQIQQDRTEKAPIAIADGSIGADDGKIDPPPKDGSGGTQEGGSWGG